MAQLVGRMQSEQAGSQLAYHEVLLAYLKVLLIQATRLKSAATGACSAGTVDLRNPVLGQLQELIEQNYRRWHAPADYADALHMTPKTLGRVVREQLGKTLTDLIQARILTHAKWQLLHTLRPVKEIAREIGFTDELYFSRLFKKATGVSPRFFREFETEIRGGSNLSMFSSVAPIQ
jgi:AraC family transcriptional activator of pobA